MFISFFRIIWNGNDPSTATDDSGVTPAATYHVKDGDIPINVNSPQTQIDTNGVIEVTTSGYTETELSGETLIGPFQKWMKQYGNSGTDERRAGQWVHIMRFVILCRCLRSVDFIAKSVDIHSGTSNVPMLILSPRFHLISCTVSLEINIFVVPRCGPLRTLEPMNTISISIRITTMRDCQGTLWQQELTVHIISQRIRVLLC